MNVKFGNWILKRVQNDIRVMPNQVLNLALKQVQGLSNSGSSISASDLSFEFDLALELWHLALKLFYFACRSQVGVSIFGFRIFIVTYDHP
jgi:hypothetical protein